MSMTETERARRAQALQGRILSAPPGMPILPTDLHSEISTLLATAYEDGWLVGDSSEVWRMVKLSTSRGPSDPSQVTLVINLGDKDQKRNTKRSRDLPHFVRFDDAWFDFALTAIADKKNPIRLDSYSFEIRFPLWLGQPPDEQRPHFLRFDLNPPEHDNTAIGDRCHMHIGSDLFSMPSPWMSPLEILEEFIYGLRPSNIPPPG